jgi:hypothetical protein
MLAGGIALAVWALAAVGDAPAPSRPRTATVLVYRLRAGMDPYESASYVPSERVARVEGPRALLTEALRELVEGVTPEERKNGFASIFSEDTADVVAGVAIDDDRAIVDFADLGTALPAAGTSEGATIMLSELNHTVFQFDRIDEVEYRMRGSCGAFWRILQGKCNVVTRTELEQVP